MYERFTDRARKVMQLANQEAQKLNHEFVGTEHILLGIMREGSGLAYRALRELGVNKEIARREVEKRVFPGPDVVSMGKLPQTPCAKKVIEYAMEEARNLNHNYVGTEHLLIGLSREGEGVAAQVLESLGVFCEVARFKVAELLAIRSAPATQDRKQPIVRHFTGDRDENALSWRTEVDGNGTLRLSANACDIIHVDTCGVIEIVARKDILDRLGLRVREQ